MLIDPDPVPIGVPLMVPTRDEPVIPSAPAWQVLSMLLMVISPPSRLAPSTEDVAVVTPVLGFTVQLALRALMLATAGTLRPTWVRVASGGQTACGVLAIVTSPLALIAQASPGR